jgi:hypothetical protein
MTIPAKSDPRWAKIASAPESFAVTGFATRMLFSRLKILKTMAKGSSSDAVDVAYDFFVKNEKIVGADLRLLFG